MTTETTQRVASYEELVAFLSQEKAPIRSDPATRAVEVAIRSQPFEGSIYLRWEQNLPYLQIIAPMIFNVEPARNNDVTEAIARANHALPLPGFAYDFSQHFIYFRITLPIDADGVTTDLLKRMILTVINNAKDSLEPLRAVVAGAASPVKILELLATGGKPVAGSS